MSEEKIKDEPAFPVMEDVERFDEDQGKWVPHLVPQGGLTKREWFAGMAMQGMLALGPIEGQEDCSIQGQARHAYRLADAMIREGKVNV